MNDYVATKNLITEHSLCKHNISKIDKGVILMTIFNYVINIKYTLSEESNFTLCYLLILWAAVFLHVKQTVHIPEQRGKFQLNTCSTVCFGILNSRKATDYFKERESEKLLKEMFINYLHGNLSRIGFNNHFFFKSC